MEIIPTPTLSALAALVLTSGLFTSPLLAAAESPVTWRSSVDRPLLDDGAGEKRVVIKIELEGSEAKQLQRTPLNLAVVLDRSGSMSGAKLEKAKQAAILLIDQLDADDVFSLVVYDTDAQVLLPAAPVGERRSEIRRLISRLETGGSTALYAGVEQGARQLDEFFSLERINRVLLLSDGIANIGPCSNEEIARLGSRLAEQGRSVTTIGLGDDYNETLMIALAEASDANNYYVADIETLPDVFAKELGELKQIVAREIVIKIQCPEGVRPLRFLGRPGSLSSREESVAFATISSDQTRELYLECSVDPGAVGQVTEIAKLDLQYRSADGAAEVREKPQTVVVGYTADPRLAQKTQNHAIIAEAAIWANAEDTERSLALADQGDYAASRAQVFEQIGKLNQVATAAPAAQQAIIAEEVQMLKQTLQELEGDQLSRAQRKAASNNSFMTRSSKR
jgi:Ca-activated chloride channel family protein